MKMGQTVKLMTFALLVTTFFSTSLKGDTVRVGPSSNEDYHRTILRTYPGSPPFLMNYRQNNITVFIGNTSHSIQNFGAMKPSNETIQRMSHFTDTAGNVVFNDKRRTYYLKQSTGRTYPVFTNVSHSTYQVAHDPKNNRVFIISRYSQSTCASLRRVSKALFSFNTLSPNIVRDKVMTKEVKPLGTNLTAISIDHETGKMVLADEVYNPKSWRLVLMEPV